MLESENYGFSKGTSYPVLAGSKPDLRIRDVGSVIANAHPRLTLNLTWLAFDLMV